jgi:hypothetical protein
MPYIYAKVDDLEGHALVGSHQCVALAQVMAGAPVTSAWREGAAVRGNLTLAKGTAIATFVNGRYPNRAHGNHAALYVGQSAAGIVIMDQWRGKNKPKVSLHTIPFAGKDKQGRYRNPSNNADAFSVIE